VKKNECLGIVGPNGSGKTTLLNMITSFRRNLTLSLKLHNNYSKDHIVSFLKYFKLYHCEYIKSSKLSNNTKQKLNLSMGLCNYPCYDTIILDEPSFNVDNKTKNEIWEIINEMKVNKTTIISTNSLEEAIQLCDRICILINGKLKCIGTIEEITNKYNQHYILKVNTN
ncbi:P-loop containing nucleoside triphosphate hydrolase protein, partial [Anaeromyces robustus]